jgi:hypothetical protein
MARKPCTHYLRYVKRDGRWNFDCELSPRIMARMREHYNLVGQMPSTVQYRKVTHSE